MRANFKTILVATILASSSAAAIGQTWEQGSGAESSGSGPYDRSAGYRYGPGMMDGYGGGPGMGGYGGGPGMGGFLLGRGSPVNLTDEQRQRIKQISDAERKQHWAVMGKMMDEQNKLRDLLEQPTPDPKAVGAAYGSISQLHQQMLESHLQARNEVHGILTPEQREQVEELRPRGGRRDGDGRGGYYGRGMRQR
jgi:Spy/CpxP family protein refolding chaperone